MPRFDSNPEVLRVDTDEMFAYDGVRTPGITAAVGASVAAFNAVLHFEDRTYNALPVVNVATGVLGLLSNKYDPARGAARVPDRKPVHRGLGEPGVLLLRRMRRVLTKVVRAMCDVLRAPDILGVIEIDNLASLTAIANAANAYGGGCARRPTRLSSWSRIPATQNTGFLVKTTQTGNPRVTVIATQRINTIEGGMDPGTIFTSGDRRPYLLRATVAGTTNPAPLPVSVILNHPRSLIDSDIPGGDAARQKRLNHALYAAHLIKRLQTEDPNVKLALIGDLNAFEFSDGMVDVMGVLRGDPVPDAATYLAGDSIDVFGTPGVADLINLTTELAARRPVHLQLPRRPPGAGSHPGES